MNRKFQECMAIVFEKEGGFANRPPSEDPGGATNFGITLDTLRDWRGDPDLTAEDVRKLTREEAREIYFARYWNPVRGDDLPMGLDLAVFDWAVHGGPGMAARTLQRVLGVRVDGVIGQQTLAAARSADVPSTIRAFQAERERYLRSRPHARANPGWFNRLAAIERAALERAARPSMTMAEARHTDTVQVLQQVLPGVTAAAGAVPAIVSAFNGLSTPIGIALIVAGLVLVGFAAYVVTVWLRTRRV
jgi:lysozyme family protein